MGMLQTAFTCQPENYLFRFVLLIQMQVSSMSFYGCYQVEMCSLEYLRVIIMFYITTFTLKIHTIKMEESPAPTVLYLSDSQSHI